MERSVGTRFTAGIEDMSLLGAGVAHIDSLAVFCPGTVAGDTAELEIAALHRRYAEARLVRLVTPSPDRCEAGCSCADRCGGCVFRAIRYEREAEIKRAAVAAALSHAGLDAAPDRIVTGVPDGYRNKAVFHLDAAGRAGIYAAATHRLVRPEGGVCRLCPPQFGEIAAATQALFAAGNPHFAALALRRAKNGRFTAVLHARADGRAARSDAARWAQALSERFPTLAGAFYASGAPEDPAARYTRLYGEDALTDVFCGLTLRVSPAAFYQVNHEIAEALCRTVCEFAALAPGERAADLYCGTGTIGMTLAAAAPDAEVVGIEINKSAVRDAEANRTRNHLPNIRFRCADSAAVTAEAGPFDCIVIDPPRRGCSEEMRRALTDLSPARIVYVSCNPATLARDAAALAASGYRIAAVRALDMFPRTGHVETVCLMSRVEGK